MAECGCQTAASLGRQSNRPPQGELVLGTPGYMAAEQLDGGAASNKTDQFSFCVALYRTLYQQPPYGGAGSVAALKAGSTSSSH